MLNNNQYFNIHLGVSFISISYHLQLLVIFKFMVPLWSSSSSWLCVAVKFFVWSQKSNQPCVTPSWFANLCLKEVSGCPIFLSISQGRYLIDEKLPMVLLRTYYFINFSDCSSSPNSVVHCQVPVWIYIQDLLVWDYIYLSFCQKL